MRTLAIFPALLLALGLTTSQLKADTPAPLAGEPLMTLASLSRENYRSLPAIPHPQIQPKPAAPNPFALNIMPPGELSLPLLCIVGETIMIRIPSTTWKAALPQKPTLLDFHLALGAQASPKSIFDVFENIIDLYEQERPWSTTTSIHILAKTDEGVGRIVPFAAIAREIDSLEDHERLGIGAGAQVQFDKHATFGTELLYFGNRADAGEPFAREVRWMTKFELQF